MAIGKQTFDQSRIEKLERELNLRQLQIKSLLAITQAINNNTSAKGLFNMYRSFLSWEMGVTRMALIIRKDKDWITGTAHNIDFRITTPHVLDALMDYKRLSPLSAHRDIPELQYFDLIVPVYHKDEPLAFTLIGGFEEEEDVYSKIQFITTITNIIAVAFENKRLFKKQLEQERLRKSLELAEEVQHMMIPESLPKTPLFELDSIYKPHFSVGGDYFDYFPFDDNRFAFCIADISGKGVAAALLMANFQAALRSSITPDVPLKTLVADLNRSIYRITKSDKFITLFIGRVNLNEQTLEYVNCGHCLPYMYINGGIENLNKGSTVLGALDQLPFINVGTECLEDESLLLMHTDGLIDLKNETGEFFDEDHIRTFIHTYHHLSASQFNKSLLRRLDHFKGLESFTDDIAILTIKINHQGLSSRSVAGK